MTAETGRPGRVLMLLVLFLGLQAVLLLAPGRIVVTNMEADVLHLLDGVARLRLGQAPHTDFETPLGTLSFAAVAMWDAPPGRAIALANLLVAALCAPLAAWLAATRLSFVSALGLGMAAMAVAAALTWSAALNGLSPAMGYNRWGWAATMLALPILLVPPRTPSAAADRGDALILGLVGAALTFMKISYAAALAPAWLAWALLSGRWRAAGSSLLAGLAALAGLAWALGGAEATLAYYGDLLAVSASETRSQPGMSPLAIASSPAWAPITLIVLASALALARAGLGAAALVFALAGAGVYAIAWQNFGNNPTGALALPFALAALIPRAARGARAFGLPAKAVLRAMAAALFALGLPWALNAERSLFGAWGSQDERVALFPAIAPDILWDVAADGPEGIVALEEERDSEAREFAGVVFPGCKIAAGYELVMAEGARALAADPALAGRTVLTVDRVNSLWLLAGAPPQRGAAPWPYGEIGAPLREAEVLAAPLCALSPTGRNAILDEAIAAGMAPRVAARSRHWIFFDNAPPGPASDAAPLPAPDAPGITASLSP